MANGNTEVLREMKKVIESGKTLDVDTRDRLLFGAVIDIYENLEQLRPALIFYQVGIYFASAIGIGILTFIGGLLTGNIELVFK